MFCPSCKDEFRLGFTRCATCNVDLVDSLSDLAPASVQEKASKKAEIGPALVPMTEYCGFLTLDEAREARERLKEQTIRSEIVIRETAGSTDEEYWLRVEKDRYREVFALLGFDEHEQNAYDDTFSCDKCGHEVAAAESFCPKCGARFEDD
jgi:rubrerythrin